MKYNWEIGPATIAVIVGAIIQIGIYIWNSSATYNGIQTTLTIQGEDIKRGAKDSKERFKDVSENLNKYNAQQQVISDRVTKVEGAVSFIQAIVQRLEQRIEKQP